MENIVLKRKCILKPQPDCPFASEMTLNPAVIRDPKTGRLHMLIRVSGPWLLNSTVRRTIRSAILSPL